MPWQPQPIVPPWKGVVDNVPSIVAPPTSFSSASGFWIDKQRLKTVSARTPLPVWTPNSGPLLGLRTFLDALGYLHTVFITATQPYYYVNGVYDAASLAALNSSLLPMSTEVYQNVLYATNAQSQIIGINGSASSFFNPLPNSGTSYFVGKLASRLLALNLIEPAPGIAGSTSYGRRFRWSAVNNPLDWTSFDAGVTDVPEIEDVITGYCTQAALGYIYHTHGITVITPTGGISPTFFVENYTNGEMGVGNFYPYSLANYGNLSAFAAEDDIYSFNPMLGPPQAIGGFATRSIYKNLAQTTSYPIGAMVPTYTNGITSLQYWLAIPLPNFTTVLWFYSFESQAWMSQVFPFEVTCISNIALS